VDDRLTPDGERPPPPPVGRPRRRGKPPSYEPTSVLEDPRTEEVDPPTHRRGAEARWRGRAAPSSDPVALTDGDLEDAVSDDDDDAAGAALAATRPAPTPTQALEPAGRPAPRPRARGKLGSLTEPALDALAARAHAFPEWLRRTPARPTTLVVEERPRVGPPRAAAGRATPATEERPPWWETPVAHEDGTLTLGEERPRFEPATPWERVGADEPHGAGDLDEHTLAGSDEPRAHEPALPFVPAGARPPRALGALDAIPHAAPPAPAPPAREPPPACEPEPLPLATYAAVKVAVWDDGLGLAEALARHGIDEVRWRAHERRQNELLAAEALARQSELADRLRAALDGERARREARASTREAVDALGLERYAALRVVAEGGWSLAARLSRLGIAPAEWDRIDAGWRARVRRDPDLGRALRRAIAQARRARGALADELGLGALEGDAPHEPEPE
jgi:hypothetical protein